MPTMPRPTPKSTPHGSARCAAAGWVAAACLAGSVAIPAAHAHARARDAPPAAGPGQDASPASPAGTAGPAGPVTPPPAPRARIDRAPDPDSARLQADASRRVIQGADDVGPLSTAQWTDLRRDVDGGFGFGSVYREGDLFMRSLGALRALFPRSEYISPRVGLSGAAIPPGTRFQIGGGLETPIWEPRPGMRNERLDDGQILTVTPGIAVADAASEPAAIRLEGRSRGRVLGTGLLNDPVVMREARGTADAGAPPSSGAPGAADSPHSPDSPQARTANRPSGVSLPGRHRTGAALSPPAVELPAIVDDPGYRRERLREILVRAVAASRGDRRPDR